MPFAGYDDFEACKRANADKDDPAAYCAAIKRQIEGADGLSEHDREAIQASDAYGDRLLEEDPCEDGWVMVGTKQQNGQTVPNCVPEEDADAANLAAADDRCGEGHVQIGDECVPVESVDAPASILSEPRIMASGAPLDTQPIKREELGNGEVRYANIKLVSEGVWTDSNSKTATLYDKRSFENIDPQYDAGKYDGPPVNIAHDLHKDGPKAGEPHAASIGGYIDPDSLGTDGTALYGDVVLDTDDAAGAFADENLKSALENDGTAGFSPSVELMPTELKEAEHPRAEEYVAAGELTGTGLVRDPASKDVDLARESQNRAVAMSASGANAKTLHREDTGMSDDKTLADADELRETLDMFGFDGLDEMTDDEVMDMAEDLHEDLMGELEGGDDPEEGEEEPEEMAEHGDKDPEEEDEEDDPDEMAAGDDMVEQLQDTVASLSERLEQIEDQMAGMATEEELSEAKSELAAADTVEEVEDRLKTLEQEPKESKTLAEGSTDSDIDWSDADDGISYDPATGSMSK